jgi:CMP-N-acetylneuraminic acid synthetase
MSLNGNKIICIICARGGSKGLPRKNLRMLAGETLIERPIRHALQSKYIDDVIVTTDSQEIADLAKKAGANAPFIRPDNLSEDLTTTEATLQHALLMYEKNVGFKFDICVFLTATDIFRNPDWIDEAIMKLNNNQNLESVFVGYKTHKNFWEQQEDGSWRRLKEWMSIYSSRQVRRNIVREDTGLACASRAFLWREGRRIGDRVAVILTDDDFTSIDIHHEDDLMLAEAAIAIRKK